MEFDEKLNLTEYLASFWNSEAVKKIKESRQNEVADHKFQKDKEFEDSILTGSYKDNPLLDAIIKINNDEKIKYQSSNVKTEENRKKLPSNLNSIQNTLNKFNKEE